VIWFVHDRRRADGVPVTDHGEGDVRELDRRAMVAVGEVIAAVESADLDRPTPCGKWSLAELLEHVVSENRGYGASALGAPAIVSIWYSGNLEPDPHRAFQDSMARVTAAFAAPGVYEGTFEVREFGYFPAPVAIGMHFVDLLVHGWDVAMSAGLPYRPEDDLASSALAIASRWPNMGARRRLYGRHVAVTTGASDFTRLLGLLGRSPSWTPPGDLRS
jgi:uncharacterized protein (TIGR03086 family)